MEGLGPEKRGLHDRGAAAAASAAGQHRGAAEAMPICMPIIAACAAGIIATPPCAIPIAIRVGDMGSCIAMAPGERGVPGWRRSSYPWAKVQPAALWQNPVCMYLMHSRVL